MRTPPEYPLHFLTLGIQPVVRKRQFWSVLEIAGALWGYWIIAAVFEWLAAGSNPQIMQAAFDAWRAQNPGTAALPSFSLIMRPWLVWPFVQNTLLALVLFWVPIHAGLLDARRRKGWTRFDIISVHPFSGLIAGCSSALLLSFWMLWRMIDLIREEYFGLNVDSLLSASFSQYVKLVGVLAGLVVLGNGAFDFYRAQTIKNNLGDLRLAGFKGHEMLIQLSSPFLCASVLFSCIHFFFAWFVTPRDELNVFAEAAWSKGLPPLVFVAHTLLAFWVCAFFAIPLSVLYHKIINLVCLFLMAIITPFLSTNIFMFGTSLTREEYGVFLRFELILLPVKVFIIARTWRRAILKLERDDVPSVG